MSVSTGAPSAAISPTCDEIDGLVTRLHKELAQAQVSLAPVAFQQLNEAVQNRLSRALSARASAQQRATAMADAPEGRTARPLVEASPTPRVPPTALVRRVLSSPSLVQQALFPVDSVSERSTRVSFVAATDTAQTSARPATTTSSMKRSQSTSTIRLLLDASSSHGALDTAQAGDHTPPHPHPHHAHYTGHGGREASASASASAVARLRPSLRSAATAVGDLSDCPTQMPHAASVACLSARSGVLSPESSFTEGPGRRLHSTAPLADGGRLPVHRSASLATILSLVEDGVSGGGGGGGGSSDGHDSPTSSPRVVQYVRVSATVAPIMVVRQRFAAFLTHRQRRELLTFVPSTLAPSEAPTTAAASVIARTASATLRAGVPCGRHSRHRYPLRVEAARVPQKPIGLSAKKAALDAQGWFCKGCLTPFKVRYGVFARGLVVPSLDEASFCFYTGGYFCARCLPPYRRHRHHHASSDVMEADVHAWQTGPHRPSSRTVLAVLPARVLQHWDFTPYPVCRRAGALLTALEEEPLYHLPTVAPRLWTSAPALLAAAQALRRQLVAMRDVGVLCPTFRRHVYGESTSPATSPAERVPRGAAYIPYTRRYLVETVEWWSLADLVELHRCEPAECAAKGARTTTMTSAVAVASLSHSLAGLFDATDAETSEANDMRVLLASTCHVLQTLRTWRRQMAQHLLTCPCCLRHSLDVCRLCLPVSSAGPAAIRRERIERQLHGLQRTGPGVSPTRTPVASRGAWPESEDALVLFMRCLLQDEEGPRPARPSHHTAVAAGARRLSPNASSTSLARSPSARMSLCDEAGVLTRESTGVLSTSATLASPPDGEAADGDATGEHDEAAQTILSRLPTAVVDHLVYVYDVVHAFRCAQCGATCHRRCLADKLGLPPDQLLTDARLAQAESATWCPECQSRSPPRQGP